jgi:hypothetical protein
MADQKPMSTTDTSGPVPGQAQQPVSAAAAAADAAKAAAEEGQKAYDEAVKQMIDRHIHDRVLAYHPHANANPDTAKAMLEDYNRLKAEADKAAADAEAAKAEASKPA